MATMDNVKAPDLLIYGASDDLLELSGAIDEEFNPECDQVSYLALSDGTVIRVTYDDDGIWRLTCEVRGRAAWRKEDGSATDDTPDRVILTPPVGEVFRWASLGRGLARAPRA